MDYYYWILVIPAMIISLIAQIQVKSTFARYNRVPNRKGYTAAMLARQGIISEQDCTDILSGLASIADDLSSGALTIDPAAEDVHTFVEQTLTARIGDAGKRLHTGRSRNDQVAGLQQDFAGLHRGAGAGAVQKGSGEYRRRHARLYPPAARPAHHLRSCADGLRFHAAARP